MPVMHTAIPCTGNTADQAVNTVHVQLGAAKHLTRPLTGGRPDCLSSKKMSKSRHFQPYPSTNKTRHNRRRLLC